MKALTVCQPWAWALIHGPKRIENRNWATYYRGPLVIHAGKSREWIKDGLPALRDNGIVVPDYFEYGAIIGVVNLVECFHHSVLPDPHRCDVYAHGPYCWVTANPRPITPHVYKGAQGLWTIPDSLIAALTECEL